MSNVLQIIYIIDSPMDSSKRVNLVLQNLYMKMWYWK